MEHNLCLNICNACGNKLLPFGELINVKVTHQNIKGLKKDNLISVCSECYCHTLKYPVDDEGFHIVDSDYKLYYIKMKKLFKEAERRDKEKPELHVPIFTLKGKEKKEVVQPTPFSFTQLPKPRSRNRKVTPFINH